MFCFGKLFDRLKKDNRITPSVELTTIDGQPEYKSSLSTCRILYEFISLEDLISFKYIQMISEELNVPSTIVRTDLCRMLDGMQQNLTICVEYPYVEEYYRDTYYSYYARKHRNYNRFCFRLTFFRGKITKDNFYDIKNIDNECLGYMVLRPTPKRIIGYSFLSPLIYTEHSFSTCLCKRVISVMGRMICITAFPFCGQDGEMNSCAEVAISMIFDYFSRRYNKYSRLFPSQIASISTDSLVDRKQPSKGVDISTIAAIMNAYGINTRQYIKINDEDTLHDSNCYDAELFYRLLHIYVESGFPIYAITEKHAIIICGRENKFFIDSPKMLVMNDNKRPYLYHQDEQDLIAFVVPMSENILLEAENIHPDKIMAYLSEDYPVLNLKNSVDSLYHRIFLTTSRSFKDHVVKSNYTSEIRERIITIAMPRFIWVCESIPINEERAYYDNIEIALLMIFDTTDNSEFYNHLLFAQTNESILLLDNDKNHMQRKQYLYYPSNERILPFLNNLKGYHKQWEI